MGHKSYERNLDYKKAFDTVSHRKLIAKLKYYGVTGQMLNWIVEFLSDRESEFTGVFQSGSQS